VLAPWSHYAGRDGPGFGWCAERLAIEPFLPAGPIVGCPQPREYAFCTPVPRAPHNPARLQPDDRARPIVIRHARTSKQGLVMDRHGDAGLAPVGRRRLADPEAKA